MSELPKAVIILPPPPSSQTIVDSIIVIINEFQRLLDNNTHQGHQINQSRQEILNLCNRVNQLMYRKEVFQLRHEQLVGSNEFQFAYPNERIAALEELIKQYLADDCQSDA